MPAVSGCRMLMVFLVLLIVSAVFCGPCSAAVIPVSTAQELSDVLNRTTESRSGAAYVNGEGKVVLLQNISLNYTISIAASTPITLSANQSNDSTIYRDFGGGYLFSVNSGTLTLEGCTGHDLIIDGKKMTDENSLVYVNGGKFNMSAGSVLRNSTTSGYGGGGICMCGGTFTMNSAAIVDSDNDVYLQTGRYISITGVLASDAGAKNIMPEFIGIGNKVMEYGSEDIDNWISNFALNSNLGIRKFPSSDEYRQ